MPRNGCLDHGLGINRGVGPAGDHSDVVDAGLVNQLRQA